MEVLRLGVKSERHLQAYTTTTAMQAQVSSVTYTLHVETTQDPYPTEQGQGSNPHSHGTSQVLNPLSYNRNSLMFFCLTNVQIKYVVPHPK